MYKQKFGPIFIIYKKSDQLFVYTKKSVRFLFKQKIGPIFLYIIHNWSDIQKIGPTFCINQKIGPIFYYKQKIGPIFCLNKKSDRFFVYTKSRSDFLYLIINRSDSLFIQKLVRFFVYNFDNDPTSSLDCLITFISSPAFILSRQLVKYQCKMSKRQRFSAGQALQFILQDSGSESDYSPSK